MATIMRQNSRFNTALPVKGEHGMLKGFSDLRRCLTPPPAGAVYRHIAPFIDAITSPETTGPMTGAALASCDQFIKQVTKRWASKGISPPVIDSGLVGRRVFS